MRASGAYLRRRSRLLSTDQTAEVDEIVSSRALRSRALRISIARWSNCSNSQRSILGPRSDTVWLCGTTTEFRSSIGRLHWTRFTDPPLTVKLLDP